MFSFSAICIALRLYYYPSLSLFYCVNLTSLRLSVSPTLCLSSLARHSLLTLSAVYHVVMLYATPLPTRLTHMLLFVGLPTNMETVFVNFPSTLRRLRTCLRSRFTYLPSFHPPVPHIPSDVFVANRFSSYPIYAFPCVPLDGVPCVSYPRSTQYHVARTARRALPYT